MEERETVQDLDALMARLAAIVDDQSVVPSEKMRHLLVALGRVQADARETEAPFKAIIQAEELKMAKAMTRLDVTEQRIRAGIQECLDVFFEHDNWKFEGDVGTAQIVKPKPRISYDTKGLETLRLSSDEMDRLIGHLRKESPSKSYLKVKLKKAK